MSFPPRPAVSKILRHGLLLALTSAVAGGLYAQKPNKIDKREAKREIASDSRDPRDMRGGRSGPEDAQSRGMSKLREVLEITDDAEWELIGARILKIGELRREVSATGGSKGGPSLSERGGKRSTGHPEQDALRAALANKLPDAEIKTRLQRAHEIYRDNEARLTKAQDDLRAVLTVRQEAVAVMAGLLPPWGSVRVPPTG
jgi:hypothetical protein